MPTSQLALARERLKTIAGTITELSGNCAVVADSDAADIECWRRYAPGDFRFLAVGESALNFTGIDAPTEIRAYLYAASGTADAEVMDDLVAALKTKWLDASNYPGGELACSAVTFQPYEALIGESYGVLLRAELTCYFPEV
ncbi:MAG TPA: hypothetical protein VKX17_02695 [Planctomycetota bacterium]|nr:hypothetical protein [Planctomycetota bacterium]